MAVGSAASDGGGVVSSQKFRWSRRLGGVMESDSTPEMAPTVAAPNKRRGYEDIPGDVGQ